MTTPKKKTKGTPLGRPRTAGEGDQFWLRIPHDKKKKYVKAAAKTGHNLSTFIRWAADQLTEKVLKSKKTADGS